MGEETKIESWILYPEDGPGFVWKGLESVTVDTTSDPVDHELIFPDHLKCTFTATLKYPKFWRCKNRKRFKKLLMSTGLFDRNQAEHYVNGAHLDYGYQKAWNWIRLMLYGV